MKQLLILFFAIGLVINIYSQNFPNPKPTNYVDSTGKLYWNKSLPVYVLLSPNPDGSDSKMLHSKVSAKYADPFYFDTEGINYIRTRWAVDKKTKKIVPNVEILWEVYADGYPPKTRAKFHSAPVYWDKGLVIYGRGLKIALTATDAVSGVKEVYYSLDSSDLQIYRSDVIVNQEGEHVFKFASIDNVNNSEKVHTKKFIVDITPPSSSATITGVKLGKENIIGISTKIYIETSDNIAGVKQVYYAIDSGDFVKYYHGQNIPITQLKDGRHILKFYAVDNVDNKEQIQTFKFYLDKTAPITVADVLGDKYVVGDKVYFSGRTKLKITSIDNKAGVKKVLYSIDNSQWQEYKEPFYLPNEPGWHIVKYFALDSTENITKDQYTQEYLKYKMKVDKIYVDLTGPSMSHFFSGEKYVRADSIFISPRTKIHLTASDPESGLQKITYSIDRELEEKPYSHPFTLDSYKPGIHLIEFFAYDNVNNRNLKHFSVILDKVGPEIGFKFSVQPIGHKDSLDVYPIGTVLFITVQDDKTGVSNIYYSVNNGQKYLYKNYISGFKRGLNTVRVETYDKLNNKSQAVIKFYISNKPQSLK